MAHKRSPVHNRVSVAQGPNCGHCAVPVLYDRTWENTSAVWVELPHLHLNETVLLPGRADMISLFLATVRAYFVLCRMVFSESQGLCFASGVSNYASSTFLALTAVATQFGSSRAINASAKMRSFSKGLLHALD